MDWIKKNLMSLSASTIIPISDLPENDNQKDEEENDLLVVSFRVSNFGHICVPLQRSDFEELLMRYDEMLLVNIEDDQLNEIEIDLSECVNNYVLNEDPSQDLIEWVQELEPGDVWERICLEPEERSYDIKMVMDIKFTPLLQERNVVYKAFHKVTKLGTLLYHFVINEDEFFIEGVAKGDTITVKVNHNGQDMILGENWHEDLERIILGLKVEPIKTFSEPTLADQIDDKDLDKFDALDDKL